MKWTLALLVVLLPNIVFGQDPGGLVTCSGPDCNLCSLVTMTNEIIQWVMGVLISLAVLGLMYAGVKLVTSGGDTGAWTSAKNMFTNVIIGFVIVLSAWLIVDTLLKMVLSKEIQDEFGPWHKIEGRCGDINLGSRPAQNIPYSFGATGPDGIERVTNAINQEDCRRYRQESIAAGDEVTDCVRTPR